ncbi:kinase-like domain-containing protein [Schizophyllum amplum]|uniref:Kinase-like domain-containing protein n=1 Tax=Schizophyllum amplum TaxID=97359 RepID=A0A550CPD0_9AGAR|nr:kinase-like domain-containing protein [Auriculariopsis ampla]
MAPCDQGVTLEGKEHHSYVLKRFFNIGNGAEKVSVSENQKYLYLEAERLCLLQEAVQGFYQLVDDQISSDKRASIADFDVTDFQIACEVVLGDGKPSRASNVTDEQYIEAAPAKLVWIMEPERKHTITKWSGTLNHPVHVSLLGQTASAIAHYFWLHTKGEMVLADMQSTEGISSTTKRLTNFLFDPMTYTTAMEDLNTSGLGDFGQKGVATFFDMHRCGAVCEMLALGNIEPEAGEDQGDEAEEADKEDNKGTLFCGGDNDHEYAMESAPGTPTAAT